MEVFERIKCINELLGQSGYGFLANIIVEELLAGGTDGERLILVCGRLLAMKEKYPDVYRLIGHEANGVIKYCRDIGMSPIPNYSIP